MAFQLADPSQLVGTWRRFGRMGPVYEVVSPGERLPDNTQTMRIRVVESGEELNYKLEEILDDPRER